MNLDQTALVEDFIIPEIELNDIKNINQLPLAKRWLTCSESEALKATSDGLPVVTTYVGNWYGVLKD